MWLNFIATIAVALIGLAGIWVQTKSKERQESIAEKLDLLWNESKKGDSELSVKIDTAKMQFLKLWLVTEMTKILNDYYKPNEEQKRFLHEAKREYNRLGGDSYVDDMFEEIKKKGLI